MKHWFEVRNSLHFLWVASETTSFTSEMFAPLDSLTQDWIVSCWRVVQKAGEHGTTLLKDGPWHDFVGPVNQNDFALSCTLPALSQLSTAVFGLGTISESFGDVATELFEAHKHSSVWSAGVAIARSTGSTREGQSTLPFAHWLDTRTGLGFARGSAMRLEQLLASLGPEACVVVPGVSSDMHRATVWASLRSFENSSFSPPGARISAELAQRRGWSARVLD